MTRKSPKKLSDNPPGKATFNGRSRGDPAPRSKRVVVTGGAGFIGSHLCDLMLMQGHEVICIDSFLTGSRNNVRPLLSHPRFSLVLQDVADPIEIDGPIDRIYNLACPASPVHYQNDPVHTLLTCVLGARQVLQLARAKGARVLQASTSEVYGDPHVHPQPEGYLGNVNPIGPRACYDEGKRCAETLFFDYHRRYGVEIKVARIFNTYGPRMVEHDGRVISNFISQALRGQPITVYGDGSQTRSFCFIDDMLEGLVRLMESGSHITGPLNLGNPHEVPVLEIAELVRRATNSTSRINLRPLPQDDPKRRRPVIDQAQTLLNWQPSVPLDRGIAETVNYFRLQVPCAVPARAQADPKIVASAG